LRDATERDWQVLLIGGGTGSGKTCLALALSKYFDVPTLEGDVLRWVSEWAVAPGSDPDLHPFHDAELWNRPEPEILNASLRQSARLCQINEVVLARHHFTKKPLILEGVWILPEFASQPSFDGIEMSGEVRSLFLYEHDVSSLAERLLSRDGELGLPSNQPTRLMMFYEYGLLIKRRAEALGLPVLTSRPFETLVKRAIEVLI
jgi:2-phosphoglycerate kinase